MGTHFLQSIEELRFAKFGVVSLIIEETFIKGSYSRLKLYLYFRMIKSIEITPQPSHTLNKTRNTIIHSTAGLSLAVSLEYLDLSNNRLKVLAGLESLGRLKDLQLENNLISKPVALRSLSLNL